MNVIRPVGITTTGSFSRASTKQCIGPDGLLQTVPVDVPAWQYDPANLSAAPVALLEGAATNLLLHSQQFDNPAWGLGTGGAIAANAVAAPDGTMTADAYTHGTSTSQFAYLIQIIAGAASDGLAYSLWIKVSGGASTVSLAASDLTVSSANSSVQVVDATWRRLTFVLAPGALASTGSIGVGITGVAGQAYHVWGAQLEIGSAATSNIPTTTGAVTRAADIITGTGLIWSNAAETAPAAYVSGTTYAKGVSASIAGTAGLITVYQSLQAPNLGHAPASSPTWWKPICTTYQVYDPAATYAIGDRVIDPVEHQTYESLVASNLGNALSDATKWYNGEEGSRWATNPFAAFDSVVGTAATTSGPLLMLVVPGAIDSLGMENISATSATIAMFDSASMTNVFAQTADLSDSASITDYDLYFFEEVETVSGLYADGLPPYYSGVVSIALAGLGAVSLGVAVFGNSFDVGGAQYGARVGFISYSKKVTDMNGNTYAKKGKTSKRMSMTTMIDNVNLDKTVRVMSDLDGVPTIYVGAANQFSALIQFAIVKEFETEIAYPSHSLCSFQIEGLI